ncbi:MAG TPA: hypothetical protein VFK02_21540 [Kofleriaceae bacterium]|nr:hypothetical protein [Kofleriaceae bacterium]
MLLAWIGGRRVSARIGDPGVALEPGARCAARDIRPVLGLVVDVVICRSGARAVLAGLLLLGLSRHR